MNTVLIVFLVVLFASIMMAVVGFIINGRKDKKMVTKGGKAGSADSKHITWTEAYTFIHPSLTNNIIYFGKIGVKSTKTLKELSNEDEYKELQSHAKNFPNGIGPITHMFIHFYILVEEKDDFIKLM